MKKSKQKKSQIIHIGHPEEFDGIKNLVMGTVVVDLLCPSNKIKLGDKMKIGEIINTSIIKKHFPVEQFECAICGDSMDEKNQCTQQANCLNISLANEQKIKSK